MTTTPLTTTIPAPRNALTSFHYFRSYDLDRLAGLNIIGDSGAYSARMQGVTITNSDLAAWAKQWSHRLAWVACMDVAGETALTRRNWHELVDDYGVPAVSSLHVGTDPAEMDYYARLGVDFLGLGGLAGASTPPKVQFRWLVQVFKYAQEHHPQMRFHGWGVTNQKLMRLPFYSVDSSSWGSGYRYGRLTLRDPATGKNHAVLLNGQDAYRPEIAALLAQHYGVRPSDVATSGPHNRHLMVQLSALSASVQEQRFRRLHRRTPLPPPIWGQLNPAELGPHQHLAMTSPTKMDVTTAMIGPHQHLAEGSSEHLELVANLHRKDEL